MGGVRGPVHTSLIVRAPQLERGRGGEGEGRGEGMEKGQGEGRRRVWGWGGGRGWGLVHNQACCQGPSAGEGGGRRGRGEEGGGGGRGAETHPHQPYVRAAALLSSLLPLPSPPSRPLHSHRMSAAPQNGGPRPLSHPQLCLRAQVDQLSTEQQSRVLTMT